MAGGKVYLVGAGPGAADLLTVRAVNVLARAEIVFHDALINEEALSHCTAGCVRVPVGTRGGFRVPNRQQRIHELLAEAAGRYGTIVRLKGGDPGVFGRGGEELEFLTARGIPWEVVPGISAGIGGLSLLGFPVTHRDVSSSVTLLTGQPHDHRHVRRTAAVGTPHTLPDPGVLHVLPARPQHRAYPGDARMPPDTPALCVSWLSYPHQALLTAPLSQIGRRRGRLRTDAAVAAGRRRRRGVLATPASRPRRVSEAMDQQHVSAIFDEHRQSAGTAAGRPVSYLRPIDAPRRHSWRRRKPASRRTTRARLKTFPASARRWPVKSTNSSTPAGCGITLT